MSSSSRVPRGDDLEFFKEYFEDNWKTTIPEREVDVPKPKIISEGDKQRRASNFADQDILICSDGGTVTYEPSSVGFRDYKIESPYDFLIRTSVDYQRFDGGRADQNYAGLTGEVRRLLDTLRFGFGPYDIVLVDKFDDNTSDVGADVFEGVFATRVISYSNPIIETGNK